MAREDREQAHDSRIHCGAGHRFLVACRLSNENADDKKRSSAPLKQPAYAISASKRDPGRTMVWLRSGPVEMQPTSTPVRFSRKAR